MKYLFFLFNTSLLAIACNSNPDYSPKPSGYSRIEFPAKKYQTFLSQSPFTFDFPAYAKMYSDSTSRAKPDWYNLTFPQFNARLHISYYPITSKQEFDILMEDSRKLAFKHTVKATGIDEGIINIPEKKVYGIFYTIDGNTASAAQFYLTDSNKHYLRGALYFNEAPKIDSVLPVINFIRVDLDKMIKTFKWKK
ncbi:MAG: gliding motility lipoprotein GldD [Sphingobacteriales bacterium]|jgi:gliding motility-associated lipoprotein GldD|nr:MAG: gliding motility lipoprotein GldD [Sphingobacteriales bacterium]